MARNLPNGIDNRFSRILTPGEGALVGKDDLVLVVLRSVQIRSLFSADRSIRSPGSVSGRGLARLPAMANREGTVQVQVGPVGGAKAGKIFEWSTGADGEINDWSQLKDALIYYGPAATGLDLSVQMVESDKEDVQALDKAKQVLGYLKTAAAFVPVYGAPAGVGLGLLNSLFESMKSTVKDSLELHHAGTVGVPDGDQAYLREGIYRIIRHRKHERDDLPPGPWDFEIQLELIRIPAPQVPFKDRKVAVILDRLHFETERVSKTLMFDAAFGGAKEGGSYSLTGKVKGQGDRDAVDLSDVAGLSGASVWAGTWGLGISFNLSGFFAPEDKAVLESMKGLIDGGSAVFNSLANKSDAEMIKTGTGIAQTLRQLALEFVPGKQVLGQRQGYLVPREFYDSLPAAAKKYFAAPLDGLPAKDAALPKRSKCPPIVMWTNPGGGQENTAYLSLLHLPGGKG